jgi:hypothetical protein
MNDENINEQNNDEITPFKEDWNLDNSFGKVPPNPMVENGMLNFLPPILKEAAEKGVKFQINSDGSCKIEGFYKNGDLNVVPNKDGKTFTAFDKRKRETIIHNFEDLVKINYDWWKQSNTKKTYTQPERPFLDYFIENKWVVRKIFFLPNEDDNDK